MARCRHCSHEIITAKLPGGATVLLDAHAKTYRGLEDTHLFPEDGDHVLMSRSLVEHSAVCAAVREGEARARGQRQRTKQAS